MAEFDLKTIFKEAFGYGLPSLFSNVNNLNSSKHSGLGQQYYSEDIEGNEFFLPVWLNEVLIPYAVVGMNWKKTYVTTPMPLRSGSVHELICIDDYSFNIKGLLVNEKGEFPEQGIIDLHELFKINTHIRMRSAISAIVLKGEEKVIIQDVKWPSKAGIEHVKAFEIQAVSDTPFVLKDEFTLPFLNRPI